MARTKTPRSNKNKKYLKTHGGDASDWVKQVVGNYPHQAGNGNVIQQNVPSINMTGGSGSDILNPGNTAYESIPGAPPTYNVQVTTPGVASITGGRNKQKGGNVVSEIAVPAVLLVANQAFRKKTGKKYRFFSRKNKSRRYSRRRR